MFNYINEVIVNDLDNVFATTSPKGFGIKRGGNYELAKIVDGKVFKTPGVKGSVGTFTIDTTKLTGYDYYSFNVFIGSEEKLGEFAVPSWMEFGKPLIVETAAASAQTVADAFKLALPNDNPIYSVAVSGTNVVITLGKSYLVPKEIRVYGVKENTDADSTVTEISDVVTTVANKRDFATADWLVENLRFPSYPNRRYAAQYSDEAPVKGTTYTQYSFQYAVKHSTPGGLSGVGQVVDSITGCVLYVPSDKASDFETKAGIAGVVTLSTDSNGYPDASKASDETETSMDPDKAKEPVAGA